jgi:hypothetical protein
MLRKSTLIAVVAASLLIPTSVFAAHGGGGGHGGGWMHTGGGMRTGGGMHTGGMHVGSYRSLTGASLSHPSVHIH